MTMGLLADLEPVLPQLRDAFISFPQMPENLLGLHNGTILCSDTDEPGSFAGRSKEFPIVFDGQYARCCPPTET